MATDSFGSRPLSRALQVWLVVVSVLLLGVSLSLLVLTEQTDRFFAWTVSPPLTARFSARATPQVVSSSSLPLGSDCGSMRGSLRWGR